jgi:hypothetical protein
MGGSEVSQLGYSQQSDAVPFCDAHLSIPPRDLSRLLRASMQSACRACAVVRAWCNVFDRVSCKPRAAAHAHDEIEIAAVWIDQISLNNKQQQQQQIAV